MKRFLTAFAITGTLILVSGCKREAEPAPVPETAPAAAEQPASDMPAPATTATTDAISVVDHNSPVGDNKTFDARAFAGTFEALGASLEIQADGVYRLNLRAESAGADPASIGTWTLDSDGKHILLDPESKAEADRRYEIVSLNELRPLDGTESLRRMP